jgi:hypothetical protein
MVKAPINPARAAETAIGTAPETQTIIPNPITQPTPAAANAQRQPNAAAISPPDRKESAVPSANTAE